MPPKFTPQLSRRSMIAGSGAAALALGSKAQARVAPGTNSDFVYEVQRTSEEWQSMLTAEEFVVLREGYTESPKTGPLWQETRPGSYHCKGCDLHVFDASTKTVLDKGWVFFFHAVPDSILTNIDGATPEYGSMADGQKALTEIHCRRCGSHLGHLLIVEGKMTHCINATSLVFNQETS